MIRAVHLFIHLLTYYSTSFPYLCAKQIKAQAKTGRHFMNVCYFKNSKIDKSLLLYCQLRKADNVV